MRVSSFNKMSKCLYCNEGTVSPERWNRRCDKCKGSTSLKKDKGVRIGRVLPSAVVQDANGNKIFVDKFGNVVNDHSYDLDKDPRGWRTTGTLPESLKII